jgi:uncharacterized protein DUF222
MGAAEEIWNWVDFPAARPAAGPTVADVIGAGFTHPAEGEFPVPDAGAFGAGGPADMMVPCSVLAELTGQALEAGMDRLTDDELVGIMRAARRVASWQAHVELAAVAELVARRYDESAPPGDGESRRAGPGPAERASAEIAAALTLTSRSADLHVDLATGLDGLENVAAALGRGEIDLAKATVFVDEVAPLPSVQASVVAGLHLMVAPSLTTAQLRSVLRRAVLAADPESCRSRQREARKDAMVQAWQEPSGNGAIAGRELPPGRTLLADRHVTALARSLRAAGMPGTLDQVRAEVFLALLSGQSPQDLLAGSQAHSGEPGRQRAGHSAGRPGGGAGEGPGGAQAQPGPAASDLLSWPAGPLGTVHLTVPLGTWLGITDNPGEVAGHGAIDAWTGRELADALTDRAGTRYCVTVTTNEGYPLGHACARSAPPGRGTPGPAPPGPPGPAPPGPEMPASGQPGPAPPALPEAMADWIGCLTVEWLERGTCSHSRENAGYKPGRLLDHLIKVRNATCTAPGCGRPAQRCDTDHVIPYHLGGRTCECNCHPLCRRHHRCKGSAGWHLEMTAPGELTWRLPHGRTCQTATVPYPV